MAADDPKAFQWIDQWEALRAELLARSPRIGSLLAERAALDWRDLPARERATLALGCTRNLDMSLPATRRQARQLLLDLERDPAQPGSYSVREQQESAWGKLTLKDHALLRADVQFIVSQDFVEKLRGVSGPVAALKFIEKNCRTLKRHQAAQFLAAIGYPMFAGDKARRRWMHRFGTLAELKESGASQLESLRAAEELARSAGVPLYEVDLLLGVFTGAIFVEGENSLDICGRKPRCGDCPLRSGCEYARLIEHHGVKAAAPSRRNLMAAVLPEDRPREKLARHGPEALSNAELLAIIIRTGSGREHAMELAAEILRAAESLDRLAHLSIAEMTRIPGLGTVKAVTIKAALELARRLATTPAPADATISLSRDVFERLHGYFLERRKEEFVVLLMNSKNRVLRQVVVTEGILNQSLVHPREAFQEAIRDSASAVIFVHNHPSGDPSPSQDDRLITQRLVKAGDVIGIRVLDHVIIGRGRYFSFADEGLLRD